MGWFSNSWYASYWYESNWFERVLVPEEVVFIQILFDERAILSQPHPGTLRPLLETPAPGVVRLPDGTLVPFDQRPPLNQPRPGMLRLPVLGLTPFDLRPTLMSRTPMTRVVIPSSVPQERSILTGPHPGTSRKSSEGTDFDKRDPLQQPTTDVNAPPPLLQQPHPGINMHPVNRLKRRD